jgi:hypothetical protein
LEKSPSTPDTGSGAAEDHVPCAYCLAVENLGDEVS